MRTFSRRSLLAALVSVAILPGHSQAQEETLKIVYPFPAGGSGDAVARILADHLHKSLGRNVVVENRTGAGGRIGAQAVKQAAPNGSVLLFGASGQFTVQPQFSPDLGYDPFADFLPVSQVVRSGLALAVSPEVPARSIGELAAWLKANPDRAIFGSPGAGTAAHFAGVELGHLFGVPLRHLPYKGTPAALPDLITGRVPLYFAVSAELGEQHKAGAIRILATSDEQRSPALPDVPTFRESGFDFVAPTWFALFAPAGTPQEATSRFETEIMAAIRVPEIRAKIEALGFQPVGSTADELARSQRQEFARWAEVVKSSGFKPD